MEYYLTIKKVEILIHGATGMNLENDILSEKRYAKGHILYDSMSMKCPE